MKKTSWLLIGLLMVTASCQSTAAPVLPTPTAMPPTATPLLPTPEPPTATPSLTSMTITFEGHECTYDGPRAVARGEINPTMDVKDQDRDAYGVVIVTLDPGKTIDDLKAMPPGATEPASWVHIVGESGQRVAGSRSTFIATVVKGPIYLVCFTGHPNMAIGVLGPIDVGK